MHKKTISSHFLLYICIIFNTIPMKIFRGPLVNKLKNNSCSLWMLTNDIKFWVKAQANS